MGLSTNAETELATEQDNPGQVKFTDPKHTVWCRINSEPTMAISIQTLRSFVKVLSLAVEPGRIKRSEAKTWWSEFRKHKPLDVATIGYPDCLFSRDQAEGVLGEGFCDDIPTRDDSQEILRWHNLHNELDEIYETKAFLKKLKIDLTVFDLKEIRGGEVIHDFNMPVLKRQHATFDIVYDGGALEHIFNAPQALQNMLLLCKVGGYIIHSNPLNIFNHGFYNFNPTLYHDFYTQNGHEIVGDMEAIKTEGLGYSSAVLPELKRFKVNGDYWIAVLAKKNNSKKPEWPLQTKYQKNPDQKVGK